MSTFPKSCLPRTIIIIFTLPRSRSTSRGIGTHGRAAHGCPLRWSETEPSGEEIKYLHGSLAVFAMQGHGMIHNGVEVGLQGIQREKS